MAVPSSSSSSPLKNLQKQPRNHHQTPPSLPSIIITPHGVENFHTTVVTSTTHSSSLLSAKYDLSSLSTDTTSSSNSDDDQRRRKRFLEWSSRFMYEVEPPRIGKLGKQKRGWGHFPINVLHVIFDHALEENELDTVLFNSYGNTSKTSNIAKALIDRVWLCKIRLVSPGWKAAVDSHPFWPSYTLIMDPSRLHHSTVTDYHSSRLTPSTPSFPTLFHRSRATTLTTCLACRLNHPSRLGLYPALQKRLTRTQKFGLAPTCDKHYAHYCMNCMREDETPSPRHPKGLDIVSPQIRASRLLPTYPRDTDEQGECYFEDSDICSECRHFGLYHQIEKELAGCARGGPVRGKRSIWSLTSAYNQYVLDGSSTAPSAAKMVLSERWLIDQTRFAELQPTALLLQKYMRDLKRRNIRTGYVEDDKAVQHRLAMLAEIRGEDHDPDDLDIIEEEMTELYDFWQGTPEACKARVLRADSGIDGNSEFWEDGEDVDEDVLDEEHVNKLKDGCVNDWLNDRIKYGFWISPEDEVNQICSQDGSLTSFLDMARGVVFPNPECGQPQHHILAQREVILATRNRTGIINLQPCLPPDGTGIRVDPFLPPLSILETLEHEYKQKLFNRLIDPLRELAKYIGSIYGSNDPRHEKRIKAAGDLNHHDVLLWLRRPELWIEGRLIREVECERAVRSMAGDVEAASDAGGGSVRSSDDCLSDLDSESEREQEQQRQVSPRIEIVDEERDEFDFEIKEIRSSEDEIELENGNENGSKLESIDREDSRSPASQTSISLGDEEKPPQSSPSSSPSSTSPAPSLGKRKSADAPHLTEKPSPKRQATESISECHNGFDSLAQVVNASPSGKPLTPSESDSRSEMALVTPEEKEPDLLHVTHELGPFIRVEDVDRRSTSVKQHSPDRGIAHRAVSERSGTRSSSPSSASDEGAFDPVAALASYPTPFPNPDYQLHVSEIPGKAYRFGYRHLVLPSSLSSVTQTNVTSLPCPTGEQLINPILSRPKRVLRLVDPSLSLESSERRWHLHTTPSMIPFVPSPNHQLGPVTVKTIVAAWENTWSPWKTCHCTICQRARRRWTADVIDSYGDTWGQGVWF